MWFVWHGYISTYDYIPFGDGVSYMRTRRVKVTGAQVIYVTRIVLVVQHVIAYEKKTKLMFFWNYNVLWEVECDTMHS